MLNGSLGGGLLTWPIQDNQIKMTENFEHDQKIYTYEP